MADEVYLLVRIVRGDLSKGENPYHYPECFDAQELGRNSRGPALVLGSLQEGALEDEALYYVETVLAHKYARACPDGFEILTEAEADAWIAAIPEMASRSSEYVTDPDRLAMITARGAAGLVATREDLQALDPDDPSVLGIGRRTIKAIDFFPAQNTRPPREFKGVKT